MLIPMKMEGEVPENLAQHGIPMTWSHPGHVPMHGIAVAEVSCSAESIEADEGFTEVVQRKKDRRLNLTLCSTSCMTARLSRVRGSSWVTACFSGLPRIELRCHSLGHALATLKPKIQTQRCSRALRDSHGFCLRLQDTLKKCTDTKNSAALAGRSSITLQQRAILQPG